MPVPSRVEVLSPAFLTGVLHAPVTDVQTTPFGADEGAISALLRLLPRYGAGAPPAPGSLVAKLPSPSAANRALAVQRRLYQRECWFYAEAAAHTPLRTPRCYHHAVDPDSGDFVLLLEDLGHYQPGDRLRGCGREQLRAALVGVAGLHAAWWGEARLGGVPWPAAPLRFVGDAGTRAAYAAHYGQVWPAFRAGKWAALAGTVPDQLLALGDALAAQAPRLDQAVAALPPSLCHGDYHAGNLRFATEGPEAVVAVPARRGRAPVPARPATGGEQAVAALDWQCAGTGPALFDVAYFLGTSADADLRRAAEPELLRCYHTALAAGGVRDCGLEEVRAQYRLMLPVVLRYCVLLVSLLELDHPRLRALAGLTLRRITEANVDHDSGALLAGLR